MILLIDSITSWLDPILGFFADLGGYSGVEKEIYKAEAGAEWLATLMEMGIDWISEGLVNRGLKALGAVATGLAGLLNKDLHPRLRKELTTIANHLTTRAVIISPRIKLASDRDRQLINALAKGDFQSAMKYAFRSPQEIQDFLKSIAPQLSLKKKPTLVEEEILTEEAPKEFPIL